MKRVQFIPTSPARRRRGFVLIIVMVIVMMVAFAGFAFVNTMSDEYRAVHTNGDLLAAEQALASAELMLLKSMESSPATSADEPEQSEVASAAGGWDDNPELFQEQLLLPERPDEEPQDDPLAWRFSVVSPNRSLDADGEETGNIRFGLENESARLHLSALVQLDAIAPDRSRAVLMAFPSMTETTADAILDWLDTDDVPREFGAEAEDYLDRPNAYAPRNGLPATLEELLLVRGVSRGLLFGPDEDRNFIIDPHETSARAQREEMSATEVDVELQHLGWADLLTLHSAEANVSSSDEPRINLNGTSGSRLREQLSPVLPPDAVDFILQYRRFGPAGGHRSGMPAAHPASRTPDALHYKLLSVCDLIDATLSVADGSHPRVVQSPFTSSSWELLAELLDRTTTDARMVIPGRINVNLAPRPVLHAVPGLEAAQIEQILARRAALDVEQLRTPLWLLTEQILTVEQFRQTLPHITTGGDVFRAQLIAWRPAGGPYRRVETVIDGTVQPARRIASRDLSAYGAAIATERLSALNGVGQLRAGPAIR